MNDATRAQLAAADPKVSTWLSANAGSGKTRVLTQRVARLLVSGVDPQSILCLTYTKAAAAEMQSRLFVQLGEWAMKDDATLMAELSEMGVEGDLREARLRDARRLFARAIETPGGLRIQTIHAFAAALLRRFPVEAGVSHGFRELDDRDAAALRATVLERMLLDAPAAVRDLAAHLGGDDTLTELTAKHLGRGRWQLLADRTERMAADFGLTPGQDVEDGVMALVQPAWTPDLLPRIHSALSSSGSTDKKAAVALEPLVGRSLSLDLIDALAPIFLTEGGKGTVRTSRSFLSGAADKASPGIRDAALPLMEAVHACVALRAAHAQAARSAALARFAASFGAAYQAAKAARGLLDFDDLIDRALALLSDADASQWVRYRLDAGLDHVLVDEAQDTSPVQWRIVAALVSAFGDDVGTDARSRTLFVVGDTKQSIYSFQGADPDQFGTWRDRFDADLADGVTRRALEHSFRSSPAIMEAVNATFTGAAAQGVEGGDTHRAFFADLPGRVDLWPQVEPLPEAEQAEHDWRAPVDKTAEDAPVLLLARKIGREVRRIIREETLPQVTKTGIVRRPVTAGDILILVRSRHTLFDPILRACKAEGVAVAGADRLSLLAELAVRDLRALLRFLALPEDDLALACALRSPLFGWSQEALHALARGRPGHLWAALRDDPAHAATVAILRDLRDRSDVLRPYELIMRALIRHRGRARLLGRLGEEAAEALDAFAALALSYEAASVPSLTGFLTWLDAEEVEIKREAEARGGKLRVMTVHGAKGLESPIVILPDTMSAVTELKDQVWTDGARAVWKMRKEDVPPSLQDLYDDLMRRQEEERRRLLYVAMTRAESWLIVCGAQPGDGRIKAGETWYGLVEQTFAADALSGRIEPLDTPAGPGRRLTHGDWTAPPLVSPAPADGAEGAAPPPLPPLPAPEAPVVLSPSGLGGAKALAGEAADDGRELGTAVHLLLEHLPGVARADRAALADRLLRGLPPGTAATARRQADALLDDPTLARLWAPGTLAEVPLAAPLPGGGLLRGTVDRLIPGDRPLCVDYKSNAVVPGAPEAVPDGILRQMGAYAHALGAAVPDRGVDLAILWTASGALMEIPHDLAMRAFRAARQVDRDETAT
ncbi:MAG: double-strand break repair helicase AddA [Paracoccaceae bacterium]